MKIILYLLSVVVVCCLLSSSALALTPIGVPAASLDRGEFATGSGFSHSRFDIKVSVNGLSVIAEDQEVDTYMANLIFGLDEKWELQIDLGTSTVDIEDMDDSGDFSGGLVIRRTLSQSEKIKWGIVGSVHWYEASGSGVFLGVPWSEENRWREFQFALGPSYKDGPLCLYGGPLIHLIDGEGKATIAGVPFSGDIEQDDWFGGFVGANVDISENITLGIEYQVTGSAYAIGANIRFAF